MSLGILLRMKWIMSFPHSSGDGDGDVMEHQSAGELGVKVALEGHGQRRVGWGKMEK